jgi:hypothetical protein
MYVRAMDCERGAIGTGPPRHVLKKKVIAFFEQNMLGFIETERILSERMILSHRKAF